MNLKSAAPLTSVSLRGSITTLNQAMAELTASLKLNEKQRRIEQIGEQLVECWQDHELSSRLMREQTRLKTTVETFSQLAKKISEADQLVQMAEADDDQQLQEELATTVEQLTSRLEEEKLQLMLGFAYATEDCYIDIQFGAGGDESQDWAKMLVRMYSGYAASRDWQVTLITETPGPHGIKSCTLLISGNFAYGHLKAETGVHRMVRKSPFDSNHRRHTTFASVFAYPLIKQSGAVQVNQSELRIDTYRSSGAGGQHVNTTDSAVRITHLPTGIVVQCQNDRSQHKNRATAMSMLISRLELAERDKQDKIKREMDANKDDIGWGSQIRSYVLDQSRVKDLRTGFESGNPQAILDGSGLHKFILASLRSGV